MHGTHPHAQTQRGSSRSGLNVGVHRFGAMANLHGAARGLLALVLLVTGAAALPKHGTSRLLLEEMLERKATDSQFLADNSECSAQNWLFVVSAGRAGSTTIMNMMNAIPTVLLSGENDGVLNILDAAFSTSQRLANMWNQRPGTAYHNNPNMTARGEARGGRGAKGRRFDVEEISSSMKKFLRL